MKTFFGICLSVLLCLPAFTDDTDYDGSTSESSSVEWPSPSKTRIFYVIGLNAIVCDHKEKLCYSVNLDSLEAKVTVFSESELKGESGTEGEVFGWDSKSKKVWYAPSCTGGCDTICLFDVEAKTRTCFNNPNGLYFNLDTETGWVAWRDYPEDGSGEYREEIAKAAEEWESQPRDVFITDLLNKKTISVGKWQGHFGSEWKGSDLIISSGTRWQGGGMPEWDAEVAPQAITVAKIPQKEIRNKFKAK